MALSIAPETGVKTTWVFDPGHTSIEFKAKHMMVTNVRGKFTGVTGSIVGDLDNPIEAQIEATIDATTIDTRNEQRDGHLRSADFLDVENHPAITFRSTRIEPAGKNRFTVFGDLTIRGVTREIELEATLNGAGKTPWGGEVVGVSVEGELNRKDFGLTWNVALETGGWLVSDNVKIELEIEATKQA